MKRLMVVLLLLLQAGCANSQDYQRYLDSHTAIQTAKYNAEAEKYKAIAQIASQSDQTAKVAAVMALSQSNTNTQMPGIVAPRSGWEIARDMFSVILPPVIQGYGIYSNQRVAISQSNNARDVSLSSNATMLGMAGLIQAPQANQTISGNGVIGSGSYSSTTSADTTTTTSTTTTSTTTDSSTTTSDSSTTTTTTDTVP